MSSINTAYKGDFLSWTINLVEARKLVHRRRVPRPPRPDQGRAAAARARDRDADRRASEGPDPALRLGAARGADGRPPTPSPTGSTYSWTDDARIMFTSGTTGRSKGVIKQNAADYFSARGLLEVVSATAGKSVESLAEDTFFSCLPLFHSNAQVLCGLPGAGRRRRGSPTSSASRRAAFWQQVIDAEATIFNRSARSATSSGTSRPRTSTAPTRCTPCFAAPGAEGHLQRVPGALRGQVHRGLRPHRDRHGDLHGPDHAAPCPGSMRQGQPGLRGHDRRAGHRPAAAARTPRARSSWT